MGGQHTYAGPTLFFVEDGTIMLKSGNDARRLQVGTYHLVRAGTPVQVQVDGRGTARLLTLAVVPAGQPVSAPVGGSPAPTLPATGTNDRQLLLHMKATDLMGHDNNPEGKVQAIERYDAMIGMVMDGVGGLIDDHVIFALAADHSTPCERREHSGDPVPVVISGRNIRRDEVCRYDEISAAKGALCRMRGSDFINTLLDYLERTKKEGN